MCRLLWTNQSSYQKNWETFFLYTYRYRKHINRYRNRLRFWMIFFCFLLALFFRGRVSSKALEFMVSALMNFNLEVSSIRSPAFLWDSITLKTLYSMDLWSQHCNFNMCVHFISCKDIFFGIFILETVMEFLEKLSDKLSERFVFFFF